MSDDNSFASRSAQLMTLLAESPEPVSASVLADRLAVSRPVVSRIASRLVQRRLIGFRRSRVDRRLCLYVLTAAGRAELDKVEALEPEGTSP